MSVTKEDFAFFAPRDTTFERAERRRYRWSPRTWDFDNDDLLLLQDGKGNCWWAYHADILKRDSDIILRPIFYFNGENQQIVRSRVLCIMDTDPRLSDFHLLSSMSKTPRQYPFDLCKTDLVATRLAGSQDVIIFTRLADGTKDTDRAATADYERAKADIRRDAKDTQNLRRFCDRHGAVGVGPSDLTKRVTLGRITDRECGPTENDTETLSGENAAFMTDQPQIVNEDPTDAGKFYDPKSKKTSIVHRFRKRFSMTPGTIEEEQLELELKQARLEKQREGCEPPTPAKRSIKVAIRNSWSRIFPKKSRMEKGSGDPRPESNKDTTPRPPAGENIDDDKISYFMPLTPGPVETNNGNDNMSTCFQENGAACGQAEAQDMQGSINYNITYNSDPNKAAAIVFPPTAPPSRQQSSGSVSFNPSDLTELAEADAILSIQLLSSSLDQVKTRPFTSSAPPTPPEEE